MHTETPTLTFSKEDTMYKAYLSGLKDGFNNPYELGSGLTWEDSQDNNEAYDTGVNHGQILGALVRLHPTQAQPFQD